MSTLARIAALLLLTLSVSTIARADEAADKAAEELLLAMKADTVITKNIEQAIEVQTKQNPAMAKFQPVLKKFFDKHMGWEAVKKDLIALYTKEFTTAELQELARFYKSPIGQKMAEKTPVLTARGMQMSQQRLQANLGELQEMLKAESSK